MSDYEFAISVHAPWAWALMFAGKDVENRSKSFPRQRDGQPVLGRVWVHASLWPVTGPLPRGETMRGNEWNCELERMERLAGFGAPWKAINEMRGHIVGSIRVDGYQTPDNPPSSKWYIPGSLAVMMCDPIPLAKPVLSPGALGWWRPNELTRVYLETAI